jgi:hypothetical protein
LVLFYVYTYPAQGTRRPMSQQQRLLRPVPTSRSINQSLCEGSASDAVAMSVGRFEENESAGSVKPSV